MKLIAYYRVSTKRQGQSGLGLAAQKQAVASYAASVHGSIAAEFREVESGKVAARPQLQAAIAAAKQQRATLVIAKLDRLARNVAFTSALMDSGCEFVACDCPHTSRLTIHILAAVVEDEARRIGERTKAALAAAKARRQQLGGGDPTKARRANVAAADAYAADIRPIAAAKRNAGWTLAEIAAYLTGSGKLTRLGKPWSTGAVSRLLAC